MRLGNVLFVAALVVVALAVTQQISLNGALAGWESITAKLVTVTR